MAVEVVLVLHQLHPYQALIHQFVLRDKFYEMEFVSLRHQRVLLDKFYRNGTCVTPTPTCSPGQILQNGVCVTPTACAYGEVRINGTCRKYTLQEQQERALNHYVPGVWAIAQNATTKAYG